MFLFLLNMMNPYSMCVAPPVDLKYEVVGSVQRTSVAFTEGLAYDGGRIIESTGRYKAEPVVINSIDPETGRVEVLTKVPDWRGKTPFGEGLARFDDKYFQLTYDSGVAFLYDAKSWKLLKTLPMPPDLKEGWGLTRVGSQLLMSNGTSTLYFLDPRTLKVARELPVRDAHGQPYTSLNMLQSVGNSVYANVFLTDRIIQIDLATGCVQGVLDMSPLWLSFSDQELQAIRSDVRENVLNGIAYDPASETFFVTGKNWPRIFKVRLKR